MRLALSLCVLGLLAPTVAQAAPSYLAVGAFEERGRGVRGHGPVLARALSYELSRSGAFALVADDKAKKAAIARIHRTNRHSVDEQHWVEIGHAVGASHLLLGEVRQDRNSCTAFAQLVHLESRASKVTRPEYYDCTNYDLVELAGELSAQLTGRRASPPNPRRHRRPPAKPVKIVMEGRTAQVDGKDYTFYDLDRPAPDAEHDHDREPAQGRAAEASRTAAGATEAPGAAADSRPEEPHAHTPATTGPPSSARPPPSPFDLDRWPALRPHLDADGAPTTNLYRLAWVLNRRAGLVAGVVLGIPIFFLLLGTFVMRGQEHLGLALLRMGLAVSVLLNAVTVAAYLLYRYGFERSIFDDADPFLVVAAPAALAVWLFVGRLLRVLPLLRLGRQILWTVALTGAFGAVLLLATQIQAPALYFGLALLALWLALRAAAAMRAIRKRP